MAIKTIGVVVAGLLAASCQAEPASRSLPAPVVEDVTRNLTEDDAGSTVVMKVGDRISISLVGIPTAGYVWAVENPPPFLKIAAGPGGPTSSAQLQPGFTGGSHWEVFVVEALTEGEADIAFVQKRPWEQGSADDRQLKFRLKAS